MLARANRITHGDDYRLVSRRGARSGLPGLSVSVRAQSDPASPTRFGFIVSKRVGVAVVRNRLRRRLKAISRELLTRFPHGFDVVYRAHPEIVTWSFDELHRNSMRLVESAVRKAQRAGVAGEHSRSAARGAGAGREGAAAREAASSRSTDLARDGGVGS